MLRGKVSSTASICVNAVQNDVFDFLVNPRNTARWNKALEYISHRPQDPIRVGTIILCRVRSLGTSIQLAFRIAELNEPNSFFGEGSSAGFSYSSRFELATSSQQGCTDVTWSVKIEYPAILSFGASYATSELSGELKRNLVSLRRIFV